jgi:S-adenosylmethionine synthetase
VEASVAYAIGEANPLAVSVDTFGTGKLPDEQLLRIVREHFLLQPAHIIEFLDLRKPQYEQVAAYGHFGRTDLDVRWEDTDMAETLREVAALV